MAKSNDSQLDAIQALRAMAAASVCLGHAIYETRLYAGRDTLSAVPRLPWAVGVDVFFIISGYIMMHTFGTRFAEPGAPWAFMQRRLLRIVPLYWLFTTALIAVALLLPGRLDSTVLTPEHALLSYLFIPHLAPGDVPRISPLFSLGWTLMYELFFYLCFALALHLRRGAGLTALLVAFVTFHAAARLRLLGTALDLFMGNTILFEFLLGIGIYLISQRGKLSWRQSIVLAVVGGSAFALSVPFGLQAERFFHYGMLGLSLFALGVQLPSRAGARWMAGLVLLGDASYVLYLSHPFTLDAIELVLGRLLPRSVVAQDWFAPGYLLLCFVGALVASVVFHRRIERPMNMWLSNKVRGGRGSAAVAPTPPGSAAPGR